MLIATFDGMKRLAMPVVLEANVQVSILFVIATAATLILNRSSAAVRHRIWSLVFCSLFLMPIFSAVVPRWTIPVIARQVSEPIHRRRSTIEPSADAPSVPDNEMRSSTPLPTPIVPETVVEMASSKPPSVDSRRPFDAANWLTFFLPIIWGIGFIATIGQLLRSQLYKRRLLNDSRIVDEEDWNRLLKTVGQQLRIRRRVRLYQSQDENIPVTWGVFRPLIVLPVSATNWPDQRRRYVLAHELSHIRRGDLSFQIVAHVCCAVYWFNPLIWFGYWRLCTECEQACDDCVVQQGSAASDYAAELVRLAKELCTGRVHAAVAMTRTTKLEQRIKALFDRTKSHLPLSRSSRVGTLIAVITLVLLTTTMRPGSRSVAADDAAKSTAADEPTSASTSPNPLVRILQPVSKDVRVDLSGDPIPEGMIQRLGGTRFKIPGMWREFAFAGDDEWIWLKADDKVSVIHRETGGSVNHEQLRLGNARVWHLSVSGDGNRAAVDMTVTPVNPDNSYGESEHRVVIISTKTTIRLHEVVWKSRRTLSSICLSHDGLLLLTASIDDVRLWNVETGELLYREAIRGDNPSVALARDGNSAIIGGQNFAFIWNFEQNPTMTKLPVFQVNSTCVAPNGRMYATLGHDGVRVWDATNCNLLANMKTDPSHRLNTDFGFSFSPDSKLLALPATSDHAIELWNVELTECVKKFPVHRPRGAVFSRDGRWLAAAGDDSVITIFDLQTGNQINQPSIGHGAGLWSLSFIDAGSLASSSSDTRVWDLKSATQQKVLAHNTDGIIQKVAVSPDGKRVVTLGLNSIGVWESTTGNQLLTIPTPNGFANTRLVQFSANGNHFATWGSKDGKLRWWSAIDGRNTATLEFVIPDHPPDRKERLGVDIWIQALTAEKLFVVYDTHLLEFDTITGALRRNEQIDERIWALAASPDGRWLAMAEAAQLGRSQASIVLRDQKTMEVVRQWPVTSPDELALLENDDADASAFSYVVQGTPAIVFSPDSKHLAWARFGRRFGIDVANVDLDVLVAKIPFGSRSGCLEFSPDGSRLASGHIDSTISLWDWKHPIFSVKATASAN